LDWRVFNVVSYEGRFEKPHIPMFNWEELGKDISLIYLRTMRYIPFGEV